VKALSFAVGLYLPLSTTLPIFAGGVVKGVADWTTRRKGAEVEDSELGGGSLMATGLVAGGALTGVVVALLQVNEGVEAFLASKLDMQPTLTRALGAGGYTLLGVLAFGALGLLLFRTAMKSQAKVD
jgi:hypothetical protein